MKTTEDFHLRPSIKNGDANKQVTIIRQQNTGNPFSGSRQKDIIGRFDYKVPYHDYFRSLREIKINPHTHRKAKPPAIKTNAHTNP